MELTNIQLIYLLIWTTINLIITLIVFRLLDTNIISKGKKFVKHRQLGKDFYCIEDKEQSIPAEDLEVYEEEEDALDGIVKVEKKKQSNKSKPIKNKKKIASKGGKK